MYALCHPPPHYLTRDELAFSHGIHDREDTGLPDSRSHVLQPSCQLSPRKKDELSKVKGWAPKGIGNLETSSQISSKRAVNTTDAEEDHPPSIMQNTDLDDPILFPSPPTLCRDVTVRTGHLKSPKRQRRSWITSGQGIPLGSLPRSSTDPLVALSPMPPIRKDSPQPSTHNFALLPQGPRRQSPFPIEDQPFAPMRIPTYVRNQNSSLLPTPSPIYMQADEVSIDLGRALQYPPQSETELPSSPQALLSVVECELDDIPPNGRRTSWHWSDSSYSSPYPSGRSTSESFLEQASDCTLSGISHSLAAPRAPGEHAFSSSNDDTFQDEYPWEESRNDCEYESSVDIHEFQAIQELLWAPHLPEASVASLKSSLSSTSERYFYQQNSSSIAYIPGVKSGSVHAPHCYRQSSKSFETYGQRENAPNSFCRGDCHQSQRQQQYSIPSHSSETPNGPVDDDSGTHATGTGSLLSAKWSLVLPTRRLASAIHPIKVRPIRGNDKRDMDASNQLQRMTFILIMLFILLVVVVIWLAIFVGLSLGHSSRGDGVDVPQVPPPNLWPVSSPTDLYTHAPTSITLPPKSGYNDTDSKPIP